MNIPSDLRIVFFGTPEFSAYTLKALKENGYNIVGVITQTSKPLGRKKELLPSPVKAYAELQGISVLEPSTLKDDAVFEQFQNLNPDLCIVVVYGKIIPQRFLDTPQYGFINIHPSLLPKYRGPSPIRSAILEGEKETGTSIMIVDSQMDHGPVLAQKGYPISDNAYHEEIKNDLCRISTELLLETIPKYIAKEIMPQEQNHDKATFTKMLTREDGRIHWNDSSEKIYNLIRALSDEPGTWTTYKGKTLRIIKAFSLNQDAPQKPGTVVKLEKDIAIANSSGYIVVEVLQLEGKKETDAKSFANGYPDFIGSVLE
jgi:methionyl-tRNA formyltransferase